MVEPAPLPDELARRPFSRADLTRAGVSQGRARRRDITRPFHGVQAVRPVGTLRERCTAYLVRMKPGQAFSHQTSVLLQGLPLPRAFEEETDLHVSATMPSPAPTTRNVVGHRLRSAPPVVTIAGGLPVVRADEAWAQMAPLLTLDESIELGDALLWQNREWLLPLQAAAAAPHRPSGARLRRAVLEIRAGAASPGETRTRLLLVRAGLPEPELNAEVQLPGERIHPDLVWRSARVAIEYEGGGHAEERRRRYDLGRYARLHDLGWTVLPISADDIQGEAGQALIRRVRRLLTP